jgi:rhodanese-related sulfurtransferase
MTTQPGGVPNINATDAAARLASSDDANGPLLVDVREDDELAVVRVADAVHVPTSAFAERAHELPKDRPLMIMCATGVRSTAVTGYLLRSGWNDVVNVDGGITAWQRAGLPVERGSRG